MSYVVIAYPDISQNDFDWIQEIRQKNDSVMYEVVKPHVTFIFPTNMFDENTLAEHIKMKIAGTNPIKVKFDSTKVVEDDSRSYFHTFLIPSKGFSEITNLHDILYTGKLKDELRVDIPFIPHVGIGTNVYEKPMLELSERIDNEHISIEGTLNCLSIAKYENNKVTDIVKIPLS